MKATRLLQQYLRILGVLPNISDRGWDLSVISNIVYYGICVLSQLTICQFFAFTAETFSEFVECFYYMIHSTLLLSWYTAYMIQRKNYGSLIIELDKIVERRNKKPLAKEMYEKSDNNIEKLIKTSNTYVVKILTPCFMLPSILPSICLYFFKHSEDTFKLIYPATFPFNHKTFLGYLVSATLQVSTVFASAIIFIITFSMTVAFCRFVSAFITDIEIHLKYMDTQLQKGQHKKMTNKKRIQVRKDYGETIQFYLDTKDFTIRFSEAHSGIIFVYLGFTIVSFCSLFLQLRASFVDLNIVGTLQTIAVFWLIVCWLFFLCYHGSFVTQRVGDGAVAAYDFAWYLLPLDIQKDLPVVLAMAQKKVFLKGFAGTKCNCDVFMTIMKTTFSYFTVLREFY